jgi:hypothetical protein
MGTIASLWRYDAAVDSTLFHENARLTLRQGYAALVWRCVRVWTALIIGTHVKRGARKFRPHQINNAARRVAIIDADCNKPRPGSYPASSVV